MDCQGSLGNSLGPGNHGMLNRNAGLGSRNRGRNRWKNRLGRRWNIRQLYIKRRNWSRWR
ncbi:hypothetical protein RHGRI_011242 [Rhododendron griersonianum]|uniref:Uncharacterized protein n=1 Tax=Rhododendron griersonianum TaxID=479676 RepID=A0AAV6KMC8_9ERIC|nr:hypothetical protein RHGRI_011242 [Rhododendron griersonianum]